MGLRAFRSAESVPVNTNNSRLLAVLATFKRWSKRLPAAMLMYHWSVAASVVWMLMLSMMVMAWLLRRNS